MGREDEAGAQARNYNHIRGKFILLIRHLKVLIPVQTNSDQIFRYLSYLHRLFNEFQRVDRQSLGDFYRL